MTLKVDNGKQENADVKQRYVDDNLRRFGNNGTNGANVDRLNFPTEVDGFPVGSQQGPRRSEPRCDDEWIFPLLLAAVRSRCGLAANLGEALSPLASVASGAVRSKGARQDESAKAQARRLLTQGI